MYRAGQCFCFTGQAKVLVSPEVKCTGQAYNLVAPVVKFLYRAGQCFCLTRDRVYRAGL